MKKIAFSCLLLTALIFTPFVSAQTDTGFRGQSMNGSTGLFSIPSGHIGWEIAGDFALDLGYRAVINNSDGIAHIPAVTLSLFKSVELSAALDCQPNFNYSSNKENEDLLLGLKIKLPTTRNTAIALGGNLQLINMNSEDFNYIAYQPYIAISCSGIFFSMPVETTVIFGKTFYSGRPNNSNIDFGMGFDLLLFPNVFKNTVHLILDFANFSYSDNSWPNYSYDYTSAWNRGILNTGFRIDLTSLSALNELKFLIDIIFNDLFDDGERSFTIGAVLGFSVR